MTHFDYTNPALPRLCVNCDKPFFPGEALLICDRCSAILALEPDTPRTSKREHSHSGKTSQKRPNFRAHMRATKKF